MSETTAVAVQAPSGSNTLVEYSSIRGTDNATKMAVLEAISDAEPMQENLGERITIQDIIIMNTTIADRATGEIVPVKRTVIITPEGKAYAAMSDGVIRSLNNLIGVFGEPYTWTEPITGTVVERGPKGRQYYTIVWGDADKKSKAPSKP